MLVQSIAVCVHVCVCVCVGVGVGVWQLCSCGCGCVVVCHPFSPYSFYHHPDPLYLADTPPSSPLPTLSSDVSQEKINVEMLRVTATHPWRGLADLERLLCLAAAKSAEFSYLPIIPIYTIVSCIGSGWTNQRVTFNG